MRISRDTIWKYLKGISMFLFGVGTFGVIIAACVFIEHNSKLIGSILLWLLRVGIIIGFIGLCALIYNYVFKLEDNKILKCFMSIGLALLICGILAGLLYVCSPTGGSYEPSIKMRPDRF